MYIIGFSAMSVTKTTAAKKIVFGD